MKVTPRYLVQLSSAEIAFLHALVQRQLRDLVAERPEGRGLELAAAPPELVSLDRRLLARLREVSDDEQAAYFGERRTRPQAAWIAEEHAALAEVAAEGKRGAALPGSAAPKALALTAGRRASNVVPLRRAGGERPRARAG